MNEQKFIPKMTGYKATNADMVCNHEGKPFKFELGVWYEHDGPIEECKSGFHFCEQPTGVWAFYSAEGTRVFKVEAEDVLETPFTPGADRKRVCRRIRLTEEVQVTGDSNTGHWNTGNRNTGHWNTGNWNTGNKNTGHSNTGDRNTGNRNTGYWNTGHWNTGNRNTGYWNTGDWNATDRSTGFFNQDVQTVRVFDVESGLTYDEFVSQYPKCHDLGCALLGNDPIPFEPYANIPGITAEKLSSLHAKFIASRQRQEVG